MITELPDQLISQAEFLLQEAPSNEANVRRAVSSAYYALFHLLVSEAALNWKHPEHHGRLVRAFEHKRMKDASTTFLKDIGQKRRTAGDQDAGKDPLTIVAETFVELQQARHKADYDTSQPFEPEDAGVILKQVRIAFLAWAEVRDEPRAQQYLYSLLFKDRPV